MKHKERFILQRITNEEVQEIGRASNIQGICDLLEMSLSTYYKKINKVDNTFIFRKKTYMILDKFDLL